MPKALLGCISGKARAGGCFFLQKAQSATGPGAGMGNGKPKFRKGLKSVIEPVFASSLVLLCSNQLWDPGPGRPFGLRHSPKMSTLQVWAQC